MIQLHISHQTWNILLVLFGILIGALIVYYILNPNKQKKETELKESKRLIEKLLDEKRSILSQCKIEILSLLENWNSLNYIPDNLNYILLRCDQFFINENTYAEFEMLRQDNRKINSELKDLVKNLDNEIRKDQLKTELKEKYFKAELLINNELHKTIDEINKLTN